MCVGYYSYDVVGLAKYCFIKVLILSLSSYVGVSDGKTV